MTVNRGRGRIPSDLGDMVDWQDDIEERVRTLEAPSGTQKAGAVGHAAGLRTYGAVGADINVPSIPNTGVTQFLFPGIEITAEVPTLEMLITASLGEASMEPDGSFVIGYVGFVVRDANNTPVPAPAGSSTGRFYTSQRMGISISTGPQYYPIPDPAVNPGPYTIKLYVGSWAATLNGPGCTANYADPSLVVQVIGAGRSL